MLNTETCVFQNFSDFYHLKSEFFQLRSGLGRRQRTGPIGMAYREGSSFGVVLLFLVKGGSSRLCFVVQGRGPPRARAHMEPGLLGRAGPGSVLVLTESPR